MIVVLCKSFKSARKAFETFVEFLKDNEPWSIIKIYDCSNSVETDDDLRYVFIDSRYQHVFDQSRPDILWVSEFFEGVNEFYYYGEEVLNWDE